MQIGVFMQEKREFRKWEALIAAPLIKEFEGLRLEAYRCPAGVLTIGWGHTGSDVEFGTRITAHQADQLLTLDMEKIKKQLIPAIKIAVTAGQFEALISLAFNVGAGAVIRSKLLSKLNAGHPEEAIKEFDDWNRCNGKVSAGLTRRRKAEAKVFAS